MSRKRLEEYLRKYDLPADLAEGLRAAALEEVRAGSRPNIPTIDLGTPDERGQRAIDTLVADPDTATTPVLTPVVERYEVLGQLGVGGMGEVLRVRDNDLRRSVAMKAVRGDRQHSRGMIRRFVHEAQVTAQLQHPGIVPVHELGMLGDGRRYFTMKEVVGHTLSDVIDELHEDTDADGWGTPESGWTLRRIIDGFRKVCEAIAYAHHRGVVHRDLKPDNIMVGDYGEVLVVDWGLAKVLGTPEHAVEDELVQTDKSSDLSQMTRVGAVAGTPAYMAPEQAVGDIESIGPHTDVYALGAILYEILSGSPPFTGKTGQEVLARALLGPPPPPGRTQSLPGVDTELHEHGAGWDLDGWRPQDSDVPPLPFELVELCRRAMARAIPDRLPDAGALVVEMTAWLEGAKKRDQALALVSKAQRLLPLIRRRLEEAEVLREHAGSQLEAIKPYAPIDDKRSAWSNLDRAAELERDAGLKRVRVNQLVNAALSLVSDLPAAHDLLASDYRRQHEAAERRRDGVAAARLEVLLRAHDTGAHADYLRGTGALSLVTDPPGAVADLFRFVQKDRHLVPEPLRSLGKTPLRAMDLEPGSYLITLRAPGRVQVRYPVFIGRGEHWQGIRPGDSAPTPVYLPRPSELVKGDAYVPAGWFWAGGDPTALNGLVRQRLWLDGFVMRRFPVTNRQYIAFLDDLVLSGRAEEAERAAPRERGGSVGAVGALVYGRGPDGRWLLQPDADGDMWELDWPVLLVDWISAQSYASWFSDKTQRSWRLPDELEWEKAARGVDGRFFPWGDFLDPSFACIRDSTAGRPRPATVDAFPIDQSPYRVRQMAGIVREWCGDFYRSDGPPVRDGRVDRDSGTDETGRANRVIRGGAWVSVGDQARCAYRNRAPLMMRDFSLGFRLARSFPQGR